MKHTGYLFLTCISTSRDALLDLSWGVFAIRYFAGDACCNGHTLRSSKFKHGLYVLSKKRCFNGHFIGVKLFDELNAALVNALQFNTVVGQFTEVNYPHREQLRRFSHHPNHSIPQNGGSWVNSKDYLFTCQSNTFAVPNKSRQLKAQQGFLIQLIQWLVFALSIAFIIWRLQNEGPAAFQALFNHAKTLYFLAALVLLPINLAIEAKKWQLLCRPFQNLSMNTATKAITAGSAYSMFTPNRIGDGLGRFHFTPKNKIPAAGYAFAMSSSAQFISTLLFGCLGFGLIKTFGQHEPTWWLAEQKWILALLLGFSIFVVFCYFSSYFLPIIQRTRFLRFLHKHTAAIQGYSLSQKTTVLLLSLLRYLVFSSQFILLLMGFHELSIFDAFARINLIYLFSTLIPTLALAELGLRESLSLVLLENMGLSDLEIFSSAFLLWVINLMLPAIYGHFTLLQKPRLS